MEIKEGLIVTIEAFVLPKKILKRLPKKSGYVITLKGNQSSLLFRFTTFVMRLP